MKKRLKYRENLYFNIDDFYVYENTFGKLFVTQVEFYNGNWYSKVGLKEKMTTIKCYNANYLKGKEITFNNLTGTISKFLSPVDLGINWKQGQNFKEFGFPYYWNNINNLTLI